MSLAALRGDALEAYAAALAAVDPAVLVKQAVRQGRLDDWLFEGRGAEATAALEQARSAGPGGPQGRAGFPDGGDRARPRPVKVLALGKAAPRMVWGLVEAKVPFTGFGACPKGMQVPMVAGFAWHAGEHPLPGDGSFSAGAALLDWVDSLADGEPVLALLSGGASSCAEVAAPRVRREDLQRRWREWMGAGFDIAELNARRAKLSVLKGGLLGERLLRITPNVRAWLLADAPPGEAGAVVGSGPLWLSDRPQRIPHDVLAGNEQAVAAAGLRLASLGYAVHRHGRRIEGSARAEAESFLEAFHRLAGDRVALVGGGEATVALPPSPPPGGRAQHAAALAAPHLHDGEAFACLATDGTDGSTDAAGAVVEAGDGPELDEAAARFASHAALDRLGRLVHSGPTGTNANDLWVALRR